MRRAVVVGVSTVAVVIVAALGSSYFSITSGRVKRCGTDELAYCGFFTSDDCTLKIKINNCGGGGSGVKVDNDDMHMCTPRKIIWKLKTEGYKFADDGIDFKDPGADFDGRQKSSDKFVWHNKHTHPANDSESPKEWRYKIHILNDNGTECATVDPRIYNE